VAQKVDPLSENMEVEHVQSDIVVTVDGMQPINGSGQERG
jgi:hypothetical protein